MSREEVIRFLSQLQQILIDSNSWKNVKQAINESFDMAIEALEAQRWIPCDKGKPDPYRRVLMTERRPDWNGKEYYIVTLDSFCNHRGDVVAWMLLPDPFKEDDE